MNGKGRILVLDDEETIVEVVSMNLTREGYDVDVALDGETAVELFDPSAHVMAILDIMLPGIDGYEVARRIRSVSDVPIMMLSARDSDVDMAVGLGIGADDYMTKPFSPVELVARVKAHLRRYSASKREAGIGRAGLGGRDHLRGTGAHRHRHVHGDGARRPGGADGHRVRDTEAARRSPGSRVHQSADLPARSGTRSSAATSRRSRYTSVACAPRSRTTPPSRSLSARCGASGIASTRTPRGDPRHDRHHRASRCSSSQRRGSPYVADRRHRQLGAPAGGRGPRRAGARQPRPSRNGARVGRDGRARLRGQPACRGDAGGAVRRAAPRGGPQPAHQQPLARPSHAHHVDRRLRRRPPARDGRRSSSGTSTSSP